MKQGGLPILKYFNCQEMKKILYAIFLLLSANVYAQVGMTVQLPPAGVVMKAQLWNAVLVSAHPNPVNVRIALRITDVATGQPLLTGLSRIISLPRGGKQLKSSDVMPVTYEYFSPAVDRNANGMLPAGNYLACYTLVVEEKGMQQPGEDCIRFTITPVSPPMLSSPANGELLDSKQPMFIWIPPAPISQFNDLNYELRLTEVRDGQSPEEAVQQNIPVYKAPRLRNSFLNYPSSGIALDTARNYAWTVTANNGNQYAAQTEVWTFRIKSLRDTLVMKGAYVQLKRENDPSMIAVQDILQFSYNNMANDAKLTYNIIAPAQQNKEVQTGGLELKPGENLLRVSPGKGLKVNERYHLQVVNSRNERWVLNFIYTGKKD